MKIIKLALRSIRSFRAYSGINLLGLALSLACVITIFRYVYGELTVDRFNKKLDRIYVVTCERSNDIDKPSFSGLYQYGSGRVKFSDLAEHPGVEKASGVMWVEDDEIDVDNRIYNAITLVADSNFLQITDYTVTAGTANLSDPRSALITASFAKKIFGEQNPVGKTFLYSNGEQLTITGIIGQTPTKSTLTFDVLVSLHLSNDWNRWAQTFVLLYPGIDYRTINRQYSDFTERPNISYKERYQLLPLQKVYFANSIGNSGVFKQGYYNHVTVLIAVGILILLAGLINYINNYTVVVLSRGRELGVKKVFGAGKQAVCLQLLTENLLMTGAALILAYFIAYLINPFISNVLQLDLIPNVRFDLLLSVLFILFLPLLTTLYPFFRFYYSLPVNTLRNFENIRDGGGMRRVFLSFQYMITFVMIIVSLFFVKQLHFMLDADPGYRTNDIIKARFVKHQPIARSVKYTNVKFKIIDGMLYPDGPNEEMEAARIKEAKERLMAEQMAEEMAQKMNASPLITHWTYNRSPKDIYSEKSYLFKTPEGEYKEFNTLHADESWLRLFEFELKAGRFFDDQKDHDEEKNIIVSESFLKAMGITDINSTVLLAKNRYDEKEFTTRIIGVINDYNYLHFSQQSTPIAMFFSTRRVESSQPLLAAIVPGRTHDAIAFLRNLHEERIGGEFEYSFIEDEVQEMYREDKKIASIYSVFTFIAILVSSLGLLSMSLFDIRQRRKEIAIRKINGATSSDVIRLLMKKYLWTLVISFVVATPVALFAINRYLEDFANKTPVSWWLFAVALITTVGVSLLTLISQTQRAAKRNPAEVINN